MTFDFVIGLFASSPIIPTIVRVPGVQPLAAPKERRVIAVVGKMGSFITASFRQ